MSKRYLYLFLAWLPLIITFLIVGGIILYHYGWNSLFEAFLPIIIMAGIYFLFKWSIYWGRKYLEAKDE